MTVVAADCQDGPAAQDLDNFEDVVRHHTDGTWCGAGRRLAPMHPITSEIVLRPGVAADKVTHFPPAPSGRATGDRSVRRIILGCNVRVMMMTATVRSCTRSTRGDRLKDRSKQEDKLEFHTLSNALERRCGRWLVRHVCGEASRLLEQCGNKMDREISQSSKNTIVLARKINLEKCQVSSRALQRSRESAVAAFTPA